MENAAFSEIALFIDFDGTLVDLHATPDAVSLPSDTRIFLERLASELNGALAIVSGRDVGNLLGVAGPLSVTLAGAHGAQIAGPDGAVRDLHADEAALAAARRALQTFANQNGLLVEQKTTGIALHFRQQPDMEGEARAFAAGLGATDASLRVIQGNMVSEVTLAAVNKGKAIRTLMSASPFAERIPIAVGDDTTDEDSFITVQELGGIGIKVGSGSTHARYRLPGVAAFVGWLERCLNEGCFRFEDLDECI
jgi:trehalose 6-phosphate phosphatase